MDNSAVIYPMSITTTTQSLFRLTAEMSEHVDEEVLQTALVNILPRFPSFAVQMRSGFFRHYFEQNDHALVVHRDNGFFMQKINFIQNRRYLFRVSYFKKKINVDFFHGLCDGFGALEFMKALIYRYLDESGTAPACQGEIKTADEAPDPGELEDGFLTYHKKYNLFGGVIGKMAGKNALQMRGRRFKTLGYGLIQGYFKTEELLALAKKYDCTITVLIAANAMLSVAEEYAKEYQKSDLVVMIPVDLRKYFESKTLSNFTSLIKCIINPNTTPRTLEDYIKPIKAQLKEGLSNKEELSEKLSLSAFMGVKWFMKIMPLFMKGFFIRTGKLLSTKTKQTMIISNLGMPKFPAGCESGISRFAFNVNVSRKAPLNMGVISYNGITTVSFTRQLISTQVEKRFFTRFSKEGLSVEIVSNLREISLRQK